MEHERESSKQKKSQQRGSVAAIGASSVAVIAAASTQIDGTLGVVLLGAGITILIGSIVLLASVHLE